MAFRLMIRASWLTVAAMAIVAGIAFSHEPTGAVLATHFDMAGRPNGFMDASSALFLPVLITAMLTVVFTVVPRIEPIQHGLEQSAPLYRAAWQCTLAIIAVVELYIAAPAFGLHPAIGTILVAVGIFFIIIGNMLPKSRPGYFVGIRTPWTLTDPDNWVATHRIGSRTMMGGGAIIIGAALLPISADSRESLVFAAMVIAILPPLLFSFVYWRRAQSRRGHSR